MGDSIAGTFLTGIMGSMAKYIGSEGGQWLLSAVLGVSSDDQTILNDLSDIETSLTTLTTAVSQLETQLGDFETLWQAETDFINLANYISPSVGDIKDCYQKLQGLQKGSTDDAYELAGQTKGSYTPPSHDFGGDLSAIHSAMTGDVTTYPDLDLMNTVAKVQLAKIASKEVASIGAAYANLQAFFSRMMVIQTQGLVLSLSRYYANKDAVDAQTQLSTFQNNIRAQFEYFLDSAEVLAVQYHQDDTLLDMMLGAAADGSGSVLDPIRAAQQFVVDNTLPGDPVPYRVWEWLGSGSSFSTGNTQADTSLTLTLNRQPITAKATPVLYPAGGNTWSRARFTFPNATASEYWIERSSINARLDAATDGTVKYGPTSVDFSASTMASFTSIGYGQLNYGLTYMNTGFVPSGAFAVSAWVFINTPGAILANGNSTVNNNGATSDTGWWEVCANSDSSITVTVEYNGVNYHGSTAAGYYDMTAWHHWAVSCDGTNMQFFLDGTEYMHGPIGAISGSGITLSARVNVTTTILRLGPVTTQNTVDQGLLEVSELCLWNSGVIDFSSPETRYRSAPALSTVWGFERGNTSTRRGSDTLSVAGGGLVYVNDARYEDSDVIPESSDRAAIRTPAKAHVAPIALTKSEPVPA